MQVPLLFKQIIDSLNLPLDPSSSTTVWMIAGATVLGCKLLALHLVYLHNDFPQMVQHELGHQSLVNYLMLSLLTSGNVLSAKSLEKPSNSC